MFISELNRNSRCSSWLKHAALGLLAAGAIAGSTGCASTECGEGTIERNDECVPADGISPEIDSCGPGTVYSAGDGACIPLRPPTECGPNTVEEIGEDGQIVCVGAGGGTCDGAIACPLPDGSNTTVCGQIVDTETGAAIQAGDGTDTSDCVAESPTADGPCSLELLVYDATQLATVPIEDATPVPADELVIDNCGRFRVANAQLPTSGILAIAAEDNTNGSADVYALSGFAQYVTPGGRVTGRPLLATTHATDEAWTASAGDPFGGQTFIEKGVAFVLYTVGGAAAPDVQGSIGGAVNAANDYYFGADEADRATIDPGATATGVNGSALLVNVGLNQVSGLGGEPDGCTWRSDLAASPAGLLFYTDRLSEDSGGTECQ